MADMLVQRELSLAARAPAGARALPLNAVDTLYAGYLLGLGALILALHARVPAWPTILGVHALCLLGIGLLAAGARRNRVCDFLHDWYPLVAFIVCFEEVARLSFLFVDHWQDGCLLALEARLFPVPPTVWLERFASLPLTELLNLGYFSYFLLLMIVGGVLYGRADRRPFRQVMTASVLSYFICYAFFLAFPTEGPAHTLAHTTPLPGGPFRWAVLLIQRLGGVHGNAFPSSHVAAGVVALIFAWRYAPRLAAALTPLVVLLCAGAVYDRYHYVSDVVAGIAVGALAAAAVLPVRPDLAPEVHWSGCRRSTASTPCWKP